MHDLYTKLEMSLQRNVSDFGDLYIPFHYLWYEYEYDMQIKSKFGKVWNPWRGVFFFIIYEGDCLYIRFWSA